MNEAWPSESRPQPPQRALPNSQPVRVSTTEQTENLGLPTQLRACEGYCRHHGFEIVQRFHEQGESAKTTERSELADGSNEIRR